MNIVYCFDNNEEYKAMAEKSAESVLKYNPTAKIHYITEDKENELTEFTTALCGFPHVSRACFLRFLIPKYLSKYDRALYLDCDTICKGDISELYNTDFEDNYIIGVQGQKYSKTQAKELGIEFYINSGVLLFNIPLMNQEQYLKQIKLLWRESLGKPTIYSADETIINYVFHKKIKLASEKYNYCCNRDYEERTLNPEDVIIWHNTGRSKECLKTITY